MSVQTRLSLDKEMLEGIEALIKQTEEDDVDGDSLIDTPGGYYC